MRTINIGADELILWLRKNNIATTIPNDQIHGLGVKINHLIISLGGTQLYDKSSYWDNQSTASNIGQFQLPQTAAQYSITTDKLEKLFDVMLTW